MLLEILVFSETYLPNVLTKKNLKEFQRVLPQPAIVSSKLAIETLEKGVKYVQI